MEERVSFMNKIKKKNLLLGLKWAAEEPAGGTWRHWRGRVYPVLSSRQSGRNEKRKTNGAWSGWKMEPSPLQEGLYGQQVIKRKPPSEFLRNLSKWLLLRQNCINFHRLTRDWWNLHLVRVCDSKTALESLDKSEPINHRSWSACCAENMSLHRFVFFYQSLSGVLFWEISNTDITDQLNTLACY